MAGIFGGLASAAQGFAQSIEQGAQSAWNQAQSEFGLGGHSDGGHTDGGHTQSAPNGNGNGNGNGRGGGNNGNGNGNGGGSSSSGPSGPSFLQPAPAPVTNPKPSPAPQPPSAPQPAPAPPTTVQSNPDPKTTNNGSQPNPGNPSNGSSGNTSSGSNNGGHTTNGGNGSSNPSTPSSGQNNNAPSGSGGNTQGSGSNAGNTGTQQSSSSPSSPNAQNQPQSQPQSQPQNANPAPAPAQAAPAQSQPQSGGSQAAAAGAGAAQQQASQPASQSQSQAQASSQQQEQQASSPKDQNPSNSNSPDSPVAGPQTSAMPVIAQTTNHPKQTSTLVLQSSSPSPTNTFSISSATAAASSTVLLDSSQSSILPASTLITSGSSPSFTSQAQSVPTNAVNPTNNSASSGGLSAASKAGIAVGVILGLVALAALIFGILTYRRRREAEAAMDEKDPFSDRAALAAEPTAMRATSPGGYTPVPTKGPVELSATPLVASSPIAEKSGPKDWSVPMDGTNPMVNPAQPISHSSATSLPKNDAVLAGAALAGAGAGAALAASHNNSSNPSAVSSLSNSSSSLPQQNKPPGALPIAAAGAIAGTATTNNAAVHRVQLDFQPSMEDELELRAGQLVRLLHEYDDGWALCVRLDRSAQGVVPRSCLSLRPVQRNNGQGPIPNQNASRFQPQMRPIMQNTVAAPPPTYGNTNTTPPRPLQAVSPISPTLTTGPGSFPDLSSQPAQPQNGRMSTVSRIDTSVPRAADERNSPVSPVSRGPSVLNRKPVGGAQAHAPMPMSERRVSQ